jgi:hypothetical protein
MHASNLGMSASTAWLKAGPWVETTWYSKATHKVSREGYRCIYSRDNARHIIIYVAVETCSCRVYHAVTTLQLNTSWLNGYCRPLQPSQNDEHATKNPPAAALA